MTEVLFVPRSTWRTTPPDSNAGAPRPLLKLPVPTITGHYTGSPWISRFRTQTAQQFMPAFEAQADRVSKSFEYNYVIPPGRPTPEVWEYAGVYQAAHSAGENHIAIGVLFGNGVNNHPSYANYDRTKPTEWEPLDDNQIIAFRWLRDVHLAGLGAVTAKTTLTPHGAMPGANTPCPGNAVLSRWAELAQPYTPPSPPLPEDPAVRYFTLINAPGTLWATSDGLVAVRLEQWQVAARGDAPSPIPVLPDAEAAKLVFLAGLPSLSVK